MGTAGASTTQRPRGGGIPERKVGYLLRLGPPNRDIRHGAAEQSDDTARECATGGEAVGSSRDDVPTPPAV